MGSKSAGPVASAAPQGDVPAFDMPPSPMPVAAPNSPVNVGMPPVAGVQGAPMPIDPRVLSMIQARQAQMGGMPTNTPMVATFAPPQMSPEDQVRMMYMSQLGRAPDQGGMDFWRQRMANGMTPDQLQNAFRASQEGQAYQQRMRPMMGAVGQPQMSPEVLDAMRLAYERNRPQRTYTPEEWSATFGPNVEPDPRMIRQDSNRQLPSNVSAALALLGRLGLGG